MTCSPEEAIVIALVRRRRSFLAFTAYCNLSPRLDGKQAALVLYRL
jgi:hypothetical protein